MEINEIVNKIKYYAQKYYEGRETIPDSEFDALVEQLRKLDPNHEILTTVGWGYDLSLNHKVKTEHLGEAYGISSKIYVNKEEVIPAFRGKVKTGKIDGGSVEVVYYLGRFMKAVSRGNGQIGIDVSHIVRHIVPTELPFPYTGNFLGEFVLPDKNMTDEDSIAQRNIPNGFLMTNEVTPEECKRFIYVPYKINKFKPIKQLLTYNRWYILDFIQDCGFNAVSRIGTDDFNDLSYEDLIDVLSTVYDRNNNPIKVPLDGIVVQSNKTIVSDPDEEGYCTIEYVDEAAYKTVNDTAEVVIDHIEWNLTRLGRMIPKAIFDKIELSGAEVKRATAHNAQYVIDSGLGAGSKIEIIRSGEVIPYIREILEPRNLEVPEVCPACGSKLVMEGVHLVCKNKDCSAKSYEAVKRWIKVLGNADNLGSSIIDALIDHFDIETIHDLYEDRFSFSELYKIDGFGKAKVQVIVNMFKKLLEPKPINHYLVALNIPGISYETAYKLIEGTSLERMILTNSYDESLLINEIYEVKGLSDSIVSTIKEYSHRIHEYLEYVRFIDFKKFYEPKKKKAVASHRVLKIYVTGKLNNFKNREDLYSQLSDRVEKESTITQCDYFVTNKQPLTTKHYKEAVDHGIKIVTEEEFLSILKEE